MFLFHVCKISGHKTFLPVLRLTQSFPSHWWENYSITLSKYYESTRLTLFLLWWNFITKERTDRLKPGVKLLIVINVSQTLFVGGHHLGALLGLCLIFLLKKFNSLPCVPDPYPQNTHHPFTLKPINIVSSTALIIWLSISLWTQERGLMQQKYKTFHLFAHVISRPPFSLVWCNFRGASVQSSLS